MDALAQIKAILAHVEKAAYRKGWDDCAASILAAAKLPASKTGDRSQYTIAGLWDEAEAGRGRIIQIVRSLVKESPGLRGNAIVDAVVAGNPGRDRKAIDRTTRTALRRLKKRGIVESRDGLWFPKEAA